MKKAPSVDKTLNEVIKYVEETIRFLTATVPPKEGGVAPEVVEIEEEMNKYFQALDHRKQAHILYFVTLLITKLASLTPKEGNIYSNAVLMARTYMMAMDKVAEPLGMDIVDVAFNVEKAPSYEMREGDLKKIEDLVSAMGLEGMEPRGNA